MREGPRRRGIRGAGPLLLALPALLAACRANGAAPPDASVLDSPDATREPLVIRPAGTALPFQGLGAGLAQGLAAAIEDGEDDLARDVLSRLEPLASTSEERAFLASCRRILAGREVQAAIHIELVLDDAPHEARRENEDPQPAPQHLYLEVLQSSDVPLRLHLPPADVEHLRTWITPDGIESRALAVRPASGLGRLLLPPGVARRIEIGPCPAAVPGALAVRDVWEVAFRSGEVERQGEHLPVRAVRAPRLERTMLAPGLDPKLPPGDVASELANALADPSRGFQDVLALAVSVAAEEREAALAAIAPDVARLAREAPERLRAVSPALRWVARTEEPGADPDGWAAWFRARETRRAERVDEDGDPRLDLP